jgi:translocation and assembly module TamA
VRVPPMPMLPIVRILLLILLVTAVPAAWGATIEVRVAGVEDELRENVLAFLSLKRYANSPDLDEEKVARLLRRAEREARSALKPFGYYGAEVVTSLTEQEGGWKAVIAIYPGPAVRLVDADVRLQGPGRDQPFLTEVLKASPLRVGEQLSHADYDRLKSALQRAAASNGYLDASWSRAELRVDPERLEARALLTLDTGERYRFGETTIEQDFLDPGLVRRYLRYRQGDWYDATLLLRTQFALDDSDYFSVVEVLPQTRDRDTLTVPIRITSEKNKRNRYRIGAGYATDTELRVLLGWTNRQLNARGHRLSALGRISTPEQSIELDYVIPWEDPALEKFSTKLVLGVTKRGDVETRGASLRPSLTQVRGRWQRVLFANLDYTRDSLPDTTAPVPDPAIAQDRTLLLVPGISFALLPPGFLDAEAVDRGLLAELLGSASALGSDSNFLRLRVRDDRRFALGGPWNLLVRGEIGASAVGDFEELPSQYRFFAGGDRSVRGYGLNELSPVDEFGNKVGGRHKLVLSVELERALPRNLAAAVFLDAGNAFNSWGDRLEYSAGVGVRYRLPFLSVGIDVAQSISESGRSPRIHLNFTPIL